MSVHIDFHNLQKQPNQSIAVIQCGITACQAGHHCDYRTYNHYSAHFILEGKGTYTVNGQTYSLEPGQGFMIFPGISNCYTADSISPWKYIYATFCGVDDDSLVRKAGLDKDHVIFQFPMDEKTLSHLYAMHEASKSYEAQGYDVAGYFLLVMSQLIRNTTIHAPRNQSPEYYIQKALEYIEINYPYDIHVQSIASYIGIERSYLYKIFMRHTGLSPSRYLYEYRLLMATKLLKESALSIQEIALSVGFHDTAHFYKTFSSKYHMTPKHYQIMYQEDR